MFHGSTHKSYWIFPNSDEVDKRRQECIDNFSAKYSISADELVTFEEQNMVCHHFEQQLYKLCLKFQPPLPYSVIFTSFVYFKRVYLQTTTMENRPEDMISVCLYMACKVEEYNVSVDKFVMIYPEADRLAVADRILGNEMNLMRLLNYHLIVHSPKRAMEGFLIDMKTRFSQGEDPETYRGSSIEFLNTLLFTNICFLYPPSQIALAALLTASKEAVRKYIVTVLASGEQGERILEKVENIIKLVSMSKHVYENDDVSAIQEKLNGIRLSLKRKAKKRKTVDSSGAGESLKRQKASDFTESEDIDAEMDE